MQSVDCTGGALIQHFLCPFLPWWGNCGAVLCREQRLRPQLCWAWLLCRHLEKDHDLREEEEDCHFLKSSPALVL